MEQVIKFLYEDKFSDEDYRVLFENVQWAKEWQTLLKQFAKKHEFKIVNAMNDSKLAHLTYECDRSRQLRKCLCDQYDRLENLALFNVTLKQIGNLEEEDSSYYYGSRYDLENEFQTECSISFLMTDASDPEIEYVAFHFDMHQDMDVGSSKVYFEHAEISCDAFLRVSFLMEHDIDFKCLEKAIAKVILDHIDMREDMKFMIKYHISNEFDRVMRALPLSTSQEDKKRRKIK